MITRKFLSAVLAAPLLVVATLAVADMCFPPPDPAAMALSPVVLGKGGELLRPYAVDGGRWRLDIKLADIDPLLQRMVIAYEDKRFYSHHGVDAAAALRAAKQMLTSGHVVSGGSTITMQLARLLSPRENRSITVKLLQMARALQLERRYSKDQILQWYFICAPYGGNLEGVRAASLSWFGKEPRKLSVAEAALLVALPQSPEARRPDKFPTRILAARNRVIELMRQKGVIAPEDAALAVAEALPTIRQDLPALAAHATNVAHSSSKGQLTIDATRQRDVERLMRAAASQRDASLSMAVLVADVRTGEVIARAGSARPFDQASRGWVDMTRAVRSPGSTLKPFIYALAFDSGIANPETLIEDRAENFRGYQPKNFNQVFHGTVTLRQALQLSLNMPAVKLLDAIGPMRLASSFREAGAEMKLPRNTSPTLAVSLGGVGMSLEDIVTLYSSFPRGGIPFTLHETTSVISTEPRPLFGESASRSVADILAGTPPPDNVLPLPIAYKTGTSYGYRDAWAIGFDSNYVVGVWVGRADGTSVAELTGRTSAAPLLFNVFAALKSKSPVFKRIPPAQALSSSASKTLKYFGTAPSAQRTTSPTLQIMFPPDGARLERIAQDEDSFLPLVVKLEGGNAPYRVLVNGAPSQEQFRTKLINVDTRVAGFNNLTVIDAKGQVASVNVFIN